MTPDDGIGATLYGMVAELFPICRSITGDGVRETLRRLQRRIPLSLHEVPTGTPVFDWTVPREWNIRDAYVSNARGDRVIDFQKSNLHVINYSVPMHRRVSRDELMAHLCTIPEQPDRIPYVTSYYSERWGFCLAHRDLARLTDAEYDVCIDATLEPGYMTFGELVVPGATADEILISAHVCHPSLANDNLSGVAIATLLARHVASQPRRYTYRFLFIPGTIGSIAWLARNVEAARRIRHGLVLSCMGDPGPVTYKRSRQGTAMVDRAAAHVLKHSGAPYGLEDFSPYGNDERQFCSPAFDLAVGCLSRTPPERYPEYHTSADDLSLVRPESLAGAFATCVRMLDVLEHDRTYVNVQPWGEPQLGKRGLYRATGGQDRLPGRELALLWVLNQSDGRHSLLDIAERAGMDFTAIQSAADELVAASLLVERPANRNGRRGHRSPGYGVPALPPATSIPTAEVQT